MWNVYQVSGTIQTISLYDLWRLVGMHYYGLRCQDSKKLKMLPTSSCLQSHNRGTRPPASRACARSHCVISPQTGRGVCVFGKGVMSTNYVTGTLNNSLSTLKWTCRAMQNYLRLWRNKGKEDRSIREGKNLRLEIIARVIQKKLLQNNLHFINTPKILYMNKRNHFQSSAWLLQHTLYTKIYQPERANSQLKSNAHNKK